MGGVKEGLARRVRDLGDYLRMSCSMEEYLKQLRACQLPSAVPCWLLSFIEEDGSLTFSIPHSAH